MIKIDAREIKANVFSGPPGGHGFRNGTWTVTYRGRRFQVYASVSHAAELDQQERAVAQSAARQLAEHLWSLYGDQALEWEQI